MEGSEAGAAEAAPLKRIIDVMNRIAPGRLAEKWDNCGLQVGHPDWSVKRIRIALDPTPDVVAAACESGTDLLITHHPLLFDPLSAVDFSTPLGGIIQRAAAERLAVYSAHTNLDSVRGGVNDVLADAVGLTRTRPLVKADVGRAFKLVFFVPADHEAALMDALFETAAGVIGGYRCCSFRSPGRGTYLPGDGAEPYAGERGKIAQADEIRVEALVQAEDLSAVLQALRGRHPYETMAYDVYPLAPESGGDAGLGRIGALDAPLSLAALAERVKRKMGLEQVRMVGDPNLSVTTVALCSGSGGGLLKAFFASGAAVYITGDLRYHDARNIEAMHLGAIDIGHFASERIILEGLARELDRRLRRGGVRARIAVHEAEKDPFIIV